MVSPQDVIYIYTKLARQGIQVWLVGGWGIDALLGKHTRPHKDLDVLMLVDDVARMCDLLAEDGYQLKELWSENKWTTDSRGDKTATAFVLWDAEGRELDAHAMRLDERSNGLPAWEVEAGFIFTAQDLAGTGTVAGYGVKCQSAENQMACHTGYRLPNYQWKDLHQLQEKYGIQLPAELLSQRAGDNPG